MAWKMFQFLFRYQWVPLPEYAKTQGIRIMEDIPILRLLIGWILGVASVLRD
jgi:4-alpha-glucanotransferase